MRAAAWWEHARKCEVGRGYYLGSAAFVGYGGEALGLTAHDAMRSGTLRKASRRFVGGTALTAEVPKPVRIRPARTLTTGKALRYTP
jgi:hypothetical protein